MIKKILVVFVFSSTLLFVFAQNNNSAVVTSPQVKSEIIATVNITNATSTQKDHVFTINFDISNDVGIQPDVHYGVSLVKIESGKQEIIDERVYSDSLILGEGEKIHKTITYQAPESFSGVYSLRLMSKNSRAIPLAFAMLGDVNLEEAKNGSIYINPTTCHLVISNGKDPKNQSINDLFLITKNDTLELSCTIKNTTKSEVTLTPSLIQNKRNAYGDTVTSVSGSTGISIAPGQSKQMYISIPKVIEPQSYYVSAFFRDQTTKTETNKIAFRYYLEGTGASIRTLLLDKDNYKKGDTAIVSFMWSPLDSSFLNEKATTTTTRPIVSVVLSLINDKKVACASQVSHVLIDSEGIIKIPIIITKECVNPEIHLSLIDKAQKVLDTQTFLITTHNKPTEQSSPIKYGTNYGIIALLSGLLVLVIIFFLKKRNKVLLTTPVITLFILVSFLGGIRNAHADSIVLFYYCTGPCPAAAAIYIDEGLDKASYAPGDTVNVNYYVSSDDNPQPTNNICPNLRAVINGLGASVGPDADPNCHTAQDLRVGYSVSASAGGVVPSGSSGTVSTSLGSNGYSNKTGQPLPFTIATPLCSWSQTSNDLSQKCNLPFTYLPSPLPSCSMSNVNTRYSGCQGTTQSEAICECVGVPPPPTVEIHFSFLDKLKLFISDIFTVLKTNSLVEYAFASVMNTKN